MLDIIRAKDVKFSYSSDEDGVVFALDGVSLSVKKGEFIAILGANGCGKSTLAKNFNAILSPSQGDVFVYEINTKDEDKIFDIRQKVGMVFQNPDNQIVATIVEEDVAFALENLGVPPLEIRSRVDAALETVSMTKFKDHSPHQLSGGQKQRIAIAGVIAMNPECIVLDEPTAMLDPKGREDVIKTIKKLNSQNNSTIILITHYMEEAVQADRVVVMDSGQVVLNDTPRNVFKEVELLKNIGLDVPQVTELAFELRKSGVNIRQDILTEQECIDELSKLLK